MQVIKLQTSHGTIARDTAQGATSCTVPVALNQFAMRLHNDVTNGTHRGISEVP